MYLCDQWYLSPKIVSPCIIQNHSYAKDLVKQCTSQVVKERMPRQFYILALYRNFILIVVYWPGSNVFSPYQFVMCILSQLQHSTSDVRYTFRNDLVYWLVQYMPAPMAVHLVQFLTSCQIILGHLVNLNTDWLVSFCIPNVREYYGHITCMQFVYSSLEVQQHVNCVHAH